MVRRISLCLFLLPLAACGGQPEPPEPPSDPTDYFYREARVSGLGYPPIRWHEQMPGRYFETTLRPTEMVAALPTAYLSRITRNYQPWARKIYDVASLSFNFRDLSPLPPEQGIGWHPGPSRDEILIELGGWDASSFFTPERYADIRNGTIERRGMNAFICGEWGGDIYFFNEKDSGEIDGNPIIAECYSKGGCEADLIFPQEMTSLGPLPINGARPYKGTVGSRIRIKFHSERISDWIEIRTKALCFVSLSIKDANLSDSPGLSRLRCNDVKRAISQTIAT